MKCVMKYMSLAMAFSILMLCFSGNTASGAAIGAPKLLYKDAATFDTGWCEEAYYSAPVVADIDGDGKLEIISSAYSINCLDAATGKTKWRVNSGKDITSEYIEVGGNVGGATSADICVADIDGDGKLEIITAHSNGTISVYDANGKFKTGWPQKPLSKEFWSSVGYTAVDLADLMLVDASIRCLVVADLNKDGKQEIIVGAGTESNYNIWVLDYTGKVMPGWPQLDNSRSAGQPGQGNVPEKSFSYGVYAHGISVGDLTGDGYLDIIVPADNAYICAYDYKGNQIKANSIFGEGKNWGKVAAWEDYYMELKQENEGYGWPKTGIETREQSIRASFTHASSAVTDVDGDGKNEVVVIGRMFDTRVITGLDDYFASRYAGLFLFNADRTRYTNSKYGYDWTNIPTDIGTPKSPEIEDAVTKRLEIEQSIFTLSVDDINKDGQKEMIFPSYDGKLHCFALDGTEPGAWPFRLMTRTDPLPQYASGAVTIDLNGDGYKEVVFASYMKEEQETSTPKNGKLYILDHTGKLLSSAELPANKGWLTKSNGCLATPVVADINGDGQYEVVLNTRYSGVAVFTIPGSSVK